MQGTILSATDMNRHKYDGQTAEDVRRLKTEATFRSKVLPLNVALYLNTHICK